MCSYAGKSKVVRFRLVNKCFKTLTLGRCFIHQCHCYCMSYCTSKVKPSEFRVENFVIECDSQTVMYKSSRVKSALNINLLSVACFLFDIKE